MALLGFRNLICHLFFVVANLFLSEINQINIYVTKWRMLQRNVKWVLTNQILWELNIEQKFKKLIKINRSYFFSYSVTSFIVIFIMPSCATIGCVSRSGKNPYLGFHQISSYKRKEIRQEWFVISNMDRMKNIFQRIPHYTSAQSILKKIVLKEICK